jgi:hypothetical protein
VIRADILLCIAEVRAMARTSGFAKIAHRREEATCSDAVQGDSPSRASTRRSPKLLRRILAASNNSSFGFRMVARPYSWPAGLNRGRKSDMKWISFSLLAAMALAILALSISAPMLSSGAYARCSDRHCMGINSPKYGQKVACPVRTCSMAGTPYAHDIRNCSAANCRK